MLPIAAPIHMDVAHEAFVQVRGEERVRQGSDIKTLETEVDPVLRYHLSWQGGQSNLVLLYQPRFIYIRSRDRRLPDEQLVNPITINTTDPNKTPFTSLHNGGIGYEMVKPRWRLSLYQFMAYGEIATSSLLRQEPWVGDVPPPDPQPLLPSTIGARFNLLFVQTQLFVPVRLSRKTALIPGLSYNAFGGADRESRGVIAMTQGPFAHLALEHAATRSDRLTSRVDAGWVSTTFQDEREGVLIYRTQATQSWRHWFNPNLSSDVTAGGALGGDEVNGFSLYSLASAAVLWDSWPLLKLPPGAPPQDAPPGHGNRLQLGAVAKVEPWIDIFSGELEQRGVVSLAANYTIDRVTLRAGLSQARVFNTPRSVAQYQIVLGEGSVRYQIIHQLAAEAGVRSAYQDFNNAIRFNELTHVTYWGALTFTPLPARF
jgi:hypothetical protein